MQSYTEDQPQQPDPAMPTRQRTNVNRMFARYMIPSRNAGAAFPFRPDFNNPPRIRYLDPDALRLVMEHKREPLTPAELRDRLLACLHEACHLAGCIAIRVSVSLVQIKDGGEGWVWPGCSPVPARPAFEALLGLVFEEERGHEVHRAARDVHAAWSRLGLPARADLPPPHDYVAEAKELAREFFREAYPAIAFIGIWLLICSAATGEVKGTRLRKIMDAARPAVIEVARRLQIIPRLDAIQQRWDDEDRARRKLTIEANKEGYLAALRVLGLEPGADWLH